MHRPIYHNDQPYVAKAEICQECSHDNVLVPVSFCPEAMKYVIADEKLLDLIDEWHDGAGLDQELHEYLGWTEEEYAQWINNYEIPEWFINEQNSM